MNASSADMTYDVARVRADFPILSTTVRGKRLAFDFLGHEEHGMMTLLRVR